MAFSISFKAYGSEVFLCPTSFNLDIFERKHKVYWENKHVEYCGIPFVMLNDRSFGCHHGRDKMEKFKQKKKEEKRQLYQVPPYFEVSSKFNRTKLEAV